MSDALRPAPTAAALTAVARLGRAVGLPVGDPQVVSDRGNLLVRLAPAPVLARVATHTARTRADPHAWLAREVAVAAHATARGGPVAAPTSLADPGPHRVDGFVISLWEHRDLIPGRAGAQVLGARLADLHRATRGVDGLPWLAAATTQISDALDTLTRAAALPHRTLAALRDRHREVLADLDGAGSEPVVLHGDAHAGNLCRDAGGWFWVDLEETCAGPPEWDLAVAAGDGDPGGVLDGYAAGTGRIVAPQALAPFARARMLEGAVWLAVMARLRPERYRDVAAGRLAQALATAPGTRPAG